MRLLDLESLLRLTEMLGAGPVRDVGLLQSAAGRPATTVFGEEAYPSIELKAAALLHSIVKGHPLVDGNKRLGWLSCVVTLDLNGLETGLGDDAAFDLVMEVAAEGVTVEEIADRLAVIPTDPSDVA